MATERLSKSVFHAIAAEMGQPPLMAVKIAPVAVTRVRGPCCLETRWMSERTINEAQEGDWLVTSLDAGGRPLRDRRGALNSYIIGNPHFLEIYERAPGECELGPLFRSKQWVEAIYFNGGVDILAPWGQRQTLGEGYLLCKGDRVYGNERASFETTYRIAGSASGSGA